MLKNIGYFLIGLGLAALFVYAWGESRSTVNNCLALGNSSAECTGIMK